MQLARQCRTSASHRRPRLTPFDGGMYASLLTRQAKRCGISKIFSIGPAILLISLAGPAQAQQGSPAGPVPVHLLAQRRALLLDRVGNGVIVLRAAHTQDMDFEQYAQAADFRQDNDFFYLTGIEAPGATLVLIANSAGPDQSILYIQPRDPAAEQWTGPRLSAEEAAQQSGITDVRAIEDPAPGIAALARQRGPVFVKSPAGSAGPVRFAGQPALDIRPQLGALRLIKDDDEVRRLRRAIEITGAAVRVAMQRAKPGMFEYEIEAWIEYTFRSMGAERVGFPSIVASGPNSTALHYDKSRRKVQAGDLIVMDVGAEFGYYTADITRTIPVTGRFTARQHLLYELVLSTQRATIEQIRPGRTFAFLEEYARDFMKKHSGELCAPRTCDEFFVHGIGHWLGMDVHDVGDMGAAFEPGMVLTIEPGIYLADEQLGIRIEDDILVTRTGYESLSGSTPGSVADIERWMAGATTPSM